MARQTHETLFISCILNTGDIHLGPTFGVRPEHFLGYQDHYRWMLDYYKQYGTCPSWSEMSGRFPHFPHDPEQQDPRWSASQVKREYAIKDMRQRLMTASNFMQKDSVEDAYALFESLSLEVVAQRPENVLVDPSFLDDYRETHEKRVTVPWPTLQELTGGIGPGELWYFAARQGRGKSSYLIDMAVQAALEGHTVCIYSLEMTKRQTQVRAHAAMASRLGIVPDANAMLRRKWDALEYKKLLEAIEANCAGSIMIHEMSMGMVTPAVVEARAGEFDLNIIDYVGLMRTNDGQPAIRDHRFMAEISNLLKSTALARNTRIVGASQINRDGATPHGKTPKLHNLAQSDHLGNDGDVVVVMNRYCRGAAIHSLEKNRHGESEVPYYTKYDANKGDFAEISKDHADDIKDREEDDES